MFCLHPAITKRPLQTCFYFKAQPGAARKLLLQLGLDKIFSALDVAKEIFSRNIGLGGRNQYFFGDARNGNDLIQPHKTVCHDLTHCVADDAAHGAAVGSVVNNHRHRNVDGRAAGDNGGHAGRGQVSVCQRGQEIDAVRQIIKGKFSVVRSGGDGNHRAKGIFQGDFGAAQGSGKAKGVIGRQNAGNGTERECGVGGTSQLNGDGVAGRKSDPRRIAETISDLDCRQAVSACGNIGNGKGAVFVGESVAIGHTGTVKEFTVASAMGEVPSVTVPYTVAEETGTGGSSKSTLAS